jgi:hypothetical protein
LDLLDACITITVDYNSLHIELLLDNESLTVFLPVLGLVSSLLLHSTTHGLSAVTHCSVSQSQSLTLRPTVSRPVCFGIKYPFLLLSDSCGFLDVGCSL